MSYKYGQTELVSRNGYAGVDGVWDKLKSGVSSALDFYGQYNQEKGAKASLEAQQQQLTAALAAQQQSKTPSWVLPVVIGGGAIAVLLLLKKRR